MICNWLAPLILAFPAADPPAWKAIKALDGSFSAEMPVEAKVLDQDVEAPPDVLRQSVYYGKSAGSFYSIQAITRPSPIPESAMKNALDADRKAYINGSGGKVLRDDQIAIDGHPAADFTLSEPTPGGKGGVVESRVRLTLADRTSYIVSVTGPPDGPLPEDAPRFLDAFHLTSNVPKPRAPIDDATPEKALRAFLIAMLGHDEPALRAVALPAAGFERLLGGQKPSAAQMVAARVALTTVPIKALKAGDEITLPGGKTLVVAPEEVAEDRAVLHSEGNPIPTRLRRIAGRWKVDPRPLIAARKAAEAAAAKKKKADPPGR